MKKIKVVMHISLDGFVAGLKGEMDWNKHDDQMFDFGNTFTDNADTALYGRTTWKMMDNYWLFVIPIILGQGISMFSKLDNRIELFHKTTKNFSCGVTTMHFTNS